MEQNKTVVIVGEDSSLKSFAHTDDSIISCALNSAIMYCDGIVDYHFMNDFGNLDTIPLEDRLRANNIAIPTFPYREKEDGLFEPDIHYPASTFIGNYPKEFRDRFILFELSTAPMKSRHIPSFPVKSSIIESALYYMLLLGYRKFNFIGIGEEKKVIKSIISILKKYDCKYSFESNQQTKDYGSSPKGIESDFFYDVLTTGEHFNVSSGTTDIVASLPKTKSKKKSQFSTVLTSISRSDLKRELNSRIGKKSVLSFEDLLKSRKGRLS